MDAIRGFARDDLSTAVFYPEDDQFLIERDFEAFHWTIDQSTVEPRRT